MPALPLHSSGLRHSSETDKPPKEAVNAQPLPSTTVPVDERIALLRPLAESGRADAMLALGRALLDCRLVAHASDEAIRDRQIDGLLKAQQMNPNALNDDVLKTMIDGTTRRYIALRDHCTNVDPAEISSWLEWIDRAAEAGDLMAAFDYVTLAVGAESSLEGEKPTVSLEEVARRKARGSELLRDLLDRGECDVLPTLVGAYAGAVASPLAVESEPDPAKAYAFMQALLLWRSEIASSEDGDWLQEYLLELAQKLDPAQIAASTMKGRAIYEQYCRGRSHNGE